MSDPGPSPLVLELARRLEEVGVGYCHWKSNLAPDRSMTADNDVDLLSWRGATRRCSTASSQGWASSEPVHRGGLAPVVGPPFYDGARLNWTSGSPAFAAAETRAIDVARTVNEPIDEDCYQGVCW